MKLNSVTRFLVEKLLKLRYEKLHDCLVNGGFDIIGRGSESIVYSRKGYEYVIKIQHSFGREKKVLCDIHFANMVVFEGCDNFNIIVQEKCKPFKIDQWPMDCKSETKIYKRWKRFSKFLQDKFDVGDTHDFNMGMKNGRLVSIDWNH